MTIANTILIRAALSLALCATAAAQTAPVPAPVPDKAKAAQMEAGEPRANVAPAPDAATPDVAAPSVAAPGVATPAAGTKPGAVRVRSATPAGGAAPGVGTPGVAKAPGASDRLSLGTTTVTGDREQPKVMYIVPWKSSNIGDLSGKPTNSLLDEALSPVDRDEFKREVAYFDAVRGEGAHNGAHATKQGEK